MTTSISRLVAATMGRTAADKGLSEQQLVAIFQALGHSSTATIARYSETVRRSRLVWIVEELEHGQPVDGLQRG